MALYVEIPKNEEKLRQAIKALEWQLTQETDAKSEDIHRKTLSIYKNALKQIKEGKRWQDTQQL